MTETSKEKLTFFGNEKRAEIGASSYPSFYKLGITALFIAGISFSIGHYFSTAKTATTNYIATTQAKYNDTTSLISQVKLISKEDFAEFNDYLFKQKHFYDAKVNYVAGSASNAYYEWTVRRREAAQTVNSMSDVTDLKESLSKYHAKNDEKVMLYTEVYNEVMTNPNPSSSKKDISKLINAYTLFKNNTFMTDADLEEDINDLLFNTDKGTVIYFQKFNVYNRAALLDGQPAKKSKSQKGI